jgi:2-oxo-4-hydroxy-4-carboxy-5-ureidoimidazoline decarboxylase
MTLRHRYGQGVTIKTSKKNLAVMTSLYTVSRLLLQPPEVIIQVLGSVYEHSVWVAEAFVATSNSSSATSSDSNDPSTITELASHLKRIVDDATLETKLKLLQAHPDLCEKVSTIQSLTEESQIEQSRSGLQSLTTDEATIFHQNNTLYKEKFGFPFILAVRNATKYTVLAALTGRVQNTREQEIVTAISQVHKIAWMRLLTKLDTSDAKGFLTCHVLDTANGCPGT